MKLLTYAQLMRLGRSSGCHQMPERSFFIRGKQFPVCARCTGVMIGNIAAYVMFFSVCYTARDLHSGLCHNVSRLVCAVYRNTRINKCTASGNRDDWWIIVDNALLYGD